MTSTTFTILYLILASSFLISHGATPPSPSPSPSTITFPITKDASKSRLYYTPLSLGTPPKSISLTLTLAGQFSWFDCDHNDTLYNSTSYQIINCQAPECDDSIGFGCLGCNNGPPKPGCTNNTCAVAAFNPFSTFMMAAGLYTDILKVPTATSHVANFPFVCAGGLKGLPKPTRGLLGLAMTKLSFQKKVSSALNLPNIFSLCLPSSGTGKLLVGGGPYAFAKDLTVTPLVINPNTTAPVSSLGDPSDEYFVSVKSIKVDGIEVKLNSTLLSFDKDGYGGTKLSTMDAHTVLHSNIYASVINAFTAAARRMKMKRAGSNGYFKVCYVASSVASDRHGWVGPTIDLVLQNENVYWRMYGSDLMVEVNKNLLCLGIVEAGKNPRTAVVVGGRQMENRVVEFDLVRKMLRFSEPLIRNNSSCSV